MSKARRTQARHPVTDCTSQVSKYVGDRSHRVQNGFHLVKEGLSGELPDSHNVVVEQPVVEPKENTLDDTRSELLRRANRSSIFRRRVQETKFEQANWQAQLV